MTHTNLLTSPRAIAHPPFSRRRHPPGAMLHCPSCRLTLRQRHPQMTIDYCPRCIARAHELVPLLQAPRTAAGRERAGREPARAAPARRPPVLSR